MSDDIAFEDAGRAGIVTLTRPQALNALTREMLLALEDRLKRWEADASIAHVVIRGEGRAFCAGGDLMALYNARGDGLSQLPFFADEYRINAAIRRYSKPYVALIDGIVMGGGVGVSVHGSHRVATENAMFAMPEVGIGFFPDVGGSYFLPRLPGRFGTYLGLTGARIRAGDMVACGIATRHVAADRLEALTAALAESGETDAVLDRFHQSTEPDVFAAHAGEIDDAFAPGSLADIVVRLEAWTDNPFFAETLKTIRSKSPTSLAVALRQMEEGASRDMDECMAMEYRIVARMLTGHDFYEGIRAAIVDKGDTPAWRPAAIGDIDAADVARYFAPLDSGELRL